MCSVPDLTALANLQSVKLNLVVGGMDMIKNLQGLSECCGDIKTVTAEQPTSCPLQWSKPCRGR